MAATLALPEGFKTKQSFPREFKTQSHWMLSSFECLTLSINMELSFTKHFSPLDFPTEEDVFGSLTTSAKC